MPSYQSVSVSDSVSQSFEPSAPPVSPLSPDTINKKRLHIDETELETRGLASSSPRNFYQEKNEQRRRRAWLYVGSDTWTGEIFACIFAILTVLATVLVLHHFNGHPAPVDLKYHITLGSVLSILSTITRGVLHVLIASGLGQIIWSKLQQGHRPLNDIALYDKASRGTFGGINLLKGRRGR
jgi:hypothetical protein